VGVVRDKLTAGSLVPGDAEVLGHVFVVREARDISDFGEEASGDDGPQTADGDEGVGEWLDGVSDLTIEVFHQALDLPDVPPDEGQGSGEHLVFLGINGVEEESAFWTARVVASGS